MSRAKNIAKGSLSSASVSKCRQVKENFLKSSQKSIVKNDACCCRGSGRVQPSDQAPRLPNLCLRRTRQDCKRSPWRQNLVRSASGLLGVYARPSFISLLQRPQTSHASTTKVRSGAQSGIRFLLAPQPEPRPIRSAIPSLDIKVVRYPRHLLL